MATYIAGVTDYIPQIQPFQPDLNFYANVMQTRQSRYDAAKKQINSLYGSLLNSPLSRDSNIQRRDAFFKAIDQDLKKISGLDLSLQQNEDAALNVFKGFYEDKYIMDDIVKTKKYRAQIGKAEALKNCNDPEKCPGYWDTGVKDLQYKMEEYKNLSDDEALNYDIGTYNAYVPWKEKAMKLVMEKGFNAELDTPSGQWIVKDKNGVLIKDGLYGLFKTVYGDDPRIQENYNTMARVTRQDEIRSTIPIHGSKEEAEKQYVTRVYNSGTTEINKMIKTTTDNYDQVSNKIVQLEKTKESKGKLNSEDEKAYNQALQERENLSKQKDYLSNRLQSLTSSYNAGDIKGLLAKSDIAAASLLEKGDLDAMAEYLSRNGMKRTYEANPYGEIAARSSARMSEIKYESAVDKDKALFDFAIKKELLDIEYKNKKELELIKQGISDGSLPSPSGTTKQAGGNQAGATLVEATPGSTEKIDLEENPGYYVQGQLKEAYQNEAQSKGQVVNYLYDIFKLAKDDASGNNGAAQYLKNNYGDNWNTIKNPQDLLVAINKNKKAGGYYNVFNNTLKELDSTKNTTGDNGWGRDYYLNNKKTVSTIKRTHDAYTAKLAMALDQNKSAANKVKASATTDNKVAKYIDLLLSPGGVFLGTSEEPPREFLENYIKAEAKAGNHDVDEDEATEAYEELKKQFYNIRNTIATSASTGAGLEGQGMTSARSINYSAVNTKNLSGVSGDIISDINSALSSNAYKAVISGSNAEDVYDEDTDPIAKQVLESLVTKSYSRDKDKPTISTLVSSVAAGKSNVGSFTVKVPRDFLDEVLGTEKKGDMAAKKEKILAEGITLFVNKDMVDSKVFSQTVLSNTQTVLKSGKPVVIDEYSDYGGVIKYSNYDPQKGTVRVTMTTKKFVNGELKDIPLEPITVPILSINELEALHIQTLENTQKNNLKELNK